MDGTARLRNPHPLVPDASALRSRSGRNAATAAEAGAHREFVGGRVPWSHHMAKLTAAEEVEARRRAEAEEKCIGSPPGRGARNPSRRAMILGFRAMTDAGRSVECRKQFFGGTDHADSPPSLSLLAWRGVARYSR